MATKAVKREPQASIVITPDKNNEGKEQFKTYQRDGHTVEVAIGVAVVVPLWVAEIAKDVGDISDYVVI